MNRVVAISARQDKLEKRMDMFELKSNKEVTEVKGDLAMMKDNIKMEIKTKVINEVKKELRNVKESMSEEVKREMHDNVERKIKDKQGEWQMDVKKKLERVSSEVKENMVKSYKEALLKEGVGG